MGNNDDRAKQFMPFDALKGLQDELRRKEAVLGDTCKKQVLDEEVFEENQRINIME